MYKCSKCHKSFTRKTNLKYHVEHNVCDKKVKIVIKMKHQDTGKNYDTMSRNELVSEINQLKGENKALRDNPTTVNNQINIVVPPAFLKVDNYKQLTDNLPGLLHNALVKHPNNFISYLIKETNCNPNLPLYNSIKVTNKKDHVIQVSDGHKYVYAPKKSIISQLIENKREILQKYVDVNGDKYGEKILKKYQNYANFLDGDKETKKDLEVDIVCMLLNVSNIIGSDEWSIKLLEDLKTWENG
jgi:DNA-directed RNA polymerase subunit RPC12/RpoP